MKKPVKAYKLVTKEEFIGVFPSISEAATELDVERSNIKRVLKGERNKVGEYTFRKL